MPAEPDVDEAYEVWSWRQARFRDFGYSEYEASELALDLGRDPTETGDRIADLIANGCDAATARRIAR